MFQRVVKPRSFVSAILEVPEVVVCVLWSFSLIMVRDCIQGPTILTLISGDNADNMWVQAHNDSRVARWDTPPFTIGDNAGDEVDPTIEVEP